MSQLFVTASASHIENQEYSILVSVTESDGKPTQGLTINNFTVHYLGIGQFADLNNPRPVTSVTEGPNGFYSLRLKSMIDYSGSDPSTKRYHRVVAVAVTTYGKDVNSRTQPDFGALVPKDHGQTIAVGELDDIIEYQSV
jgi:hypothetical protein